MYLLNTIINNVFLVFLTDRQVQVFKLFSKRVLMIKKNFNLHKMQ